MDKTSPKSSEIVRPQIDLDQLYDAESIARWMDLSKPTLLKLVREEKIPVVRLNRRVFRFHPRTILQHCSPKIPEAWPPKSKTERTFCYFIRNSSGLVKIGRSVDPPDRVKALQAANSDALELLFYLPSTAVSERSLHKRFGPKRVDGEWFNLSAKEIELVKLEFRELVQTIA